MDDVGSQGCRKLEGRTLPLLHPRLGAQDRGKNQQGGKGGGATPTFSAVARAKIEGKHGGYGDARQAIPFPHPACIHITAPRGVEDANWRVAN